MQFWGIELDYCIVNWINTEGGYMGQNTIYLKSAGWKCKHLDVMNAWTMYEQQASSIKNISAQSFTRLSNLSQYYTEMTSNEGYKNDILHYYLLSTLE